MFIVVLDQATDDHREAVQAIVKAHANGWWHNFTDVWIVGGHEVTYWRDLIKPTLALSPARVLVMGLPDMGQRAWATAGLPQPMFKWLREAYSNKPPADHASPLNPFLPVRPSTKDDDIPF